MLAVGRALMTRARLLLLDEPSMGLAPLLVREIFRVIQRINQQGAAILLVEQNAHLALEVAHRAYILETGEIALTGPAAELRHHPQVLEAYLGGRERLGRSGQRLCPLDFPRHPYGRLGQGEPQRGANWLTKDLTVDYSWLFFRSVMSWINPS